MNQQTIRNSMQTAGAGAQPNKPLAKFRAGAIVATLWQNSAKGAAGEVKFMSITLDRRYQDKEGAWQSTSSLRTNDLPRAGLVLQKAYEYIVLKGQNSTFGKSENALDAEGHGAEEEAVIA